MVFIGIAATLVHKHLLQRLVQDPERLRPTIPTLGATYVPPATDLRHDSPKWYDIVHEFSCLCFGLSQKASYQGR